jgi:hypothetical protein
MEPNYDQLIGELINNKVVGSEALFKQAGIAYYLKERLGVSAKQIGSDVAYSARFVNNMVRTFSVFPDPDSRAQDLSYSHHQVAAHTDDPFYWLDRACAEAWSVREMSKAVKGQQVKDELREADRAVGVIERIFEAGGQPARYVYDRLTILLQEVDPDYRDFVCADSEASQATEAGQEEERQAVEVS